MLRRGRCLSFIGVLWAIGFSIHPVPAYAGAATGNASHRVVVLDPVAAAARFIRVSDGTDCAALFDENNADLFQALDANSNPCVPVFVRDGASLAQLNGEQTITTCQLPEGGGLVSIELVVATSFSSAQNPGLAADLDLPIQTFFGTGIDPNDAYCQGDFDAPGAEIPGTGWFPIPSGDCVASTNYDGMVIPINGSQAGDTIPEILGAAAQEAFPAANGFDPVPLILSAGVDGMGNPISTDAFSTTFLGNGPLPSCVGGTPTSHRFEVDVLFAQPAGFVPQQVPSLTLTTLGALALTVMIFGWACTRRSSFRFGALRR